MDDAKYPVRFLGNTQYVPGIADTRYFVLGVFSSKEKHLIEAAFNDQVKIIERKYQKMFNNILPDYDFVLKAEKAHYTESTRQYSAMVVNYVIHWEFALYFKTAEDQVRFFLSNPFDLPVGDITMG